MATRIEYPGGTTCSICGKSAGSIVLGAPGGVRVEHRDFTCTAVRLPLISLRDQKPMNGRRRYKIKATLIDPFELEPISPKIDGALGR